MLTAALLALLVLLAVGVAVALVVAVGCAVHLVRHRGEVADAPDVSQGMRDAREALRDGLMDVADATAEDYYDTDGVCIEGFTPLETAVLRANYLAMTDDERFRLDMAWLSIVEGAEQ